MAIFLTLYRHRFAIGYRSKASTNITHSGMPDEVMMVYTAGIVAITI